LAETMDDPLQKTRRGGSKNNIIHIEKQKCHISTPAEYEQRNVSLRLNKSKRSYMSCEAVMSGSGCLLQTIE
jgi:hypothetical protein